MNIDQSCQERVPTSAMLKCCYRATADMTVAVQWSHSLPAGDLTSGPPVSQAGPPVMSPLVPGHSQSVVRTGHY